MKDSSNQLGTISKVLTILAVIIGTLILGVCAFGAFTRTTYADNMAAQTMLEKTDNILLTGLLTGAAVTAMVLLVLFLSSEKNINKMFIAGIVWYIVAGAVMIFFGRSVPGADALTVYKMGEMFANNDLSFINPTESYLSYYPQQIGLTTFLGMIIKVLKVLPYTFAYYHAIKILYVFLNCVSFIFGCLLIRELQNDNKVTMTYIILSMINLPFIMYSSFIYGEIPSIALLLGAIFFFTKYIKEKGIAPLNMILSLSMFTAAVWIRKNSLIFIIAVLIVCILVFLENRRADVLLYALICAVCCFLVIPLTLKIYENKTGREVNDGVTATSYFAMAMQEGSRGPGWYNGFNYDTYTNSGMDADKANEVSRAAIKERTEYFKNNPSECYKFYKGKILTQWADPTYASCQATYAEYGGRSKFFVSVYEGKLYNAYIEICNIYQNLIYAGVLVWAIAFLVSALRGKERNIQIDSLLLIAVTGGFLFHIIWEANSRYIFPYAQMLLIYAAIGIGTFAGKMSMGSKGVDRE